MMSLDIASIVGFGKNLIEVTFKRGNSKIQIPFKYDNFPCNYIKEYFLLRNFPCDQIIDGTLDPAYFVVTENFE